MTTIQRKMDNVGNIMTLEEDQEKINQAIFQHMFKSDISRDILFLKVDQLENQIQSLTEKFTKE